MNKAIKAMEKLIATVLIAMGGMAARIASNNIQERRRVDQIVYETGV